MKRVCIVAILLSILLSGCSFSHGVIFADLGNSGTVTGITGYYSADFWPGDYNPNFVCSNCF